MDKHLAQERTQGLLSLLGLEDKMHTPSGQLSGGMKRRLMIARALVHGPKGLQRFLVWKRRPCIFWMTVQVILKAGGLLEWGAGGRSAPEKNFP